MKKKKLGTLDRVLIFCAFCLLIFSIVMIVLFCIYQNIPDTLVVAFFGAFGIETINCVMVYKNKQNKANNCDTENIGENEDE